MNTLLLLGATSLLAAGSTGGASIVGTWRTPVDESVVRIEACGDLMCGRIETSTILAANPDQRDVRNVDPALRSRRGKGLLMLQLRSKGPGTWGDGWVYDPLRGRTFKASAVMGSGGKLLFTGCVIALVCQTQVWTRMR